VAGAGRERRHPLGAASAAQRRGRAESAAKPASSRSPRADRHQGTARHRADLPGRRFLVYMPFASKVGVSARSRTGNSAPSCARWCPNSSPRTRGRAAGSSAPGRRPHGAELQARVDHLYGLWTKIKRKSGSVRAPALLATGDVAHPRHHPRPLLGQGRLAARRFKGAAQRGGAVPEADRPRSARPP